MSFYKRIDKKKSIAKAKIVLKEYSRFIKILDNNLYDLSVTSPNLTTTFSSSINADARLINHIQLKDRNYNEIQKHVQEINNCINSLSIEYIELLNMKYIECLTNDCIAERLSCCGKITSTRQVERKIKEAYIDFSLAYGIYTIIDENVNEIGE